MYKRQQYDQPRADQLSARTFSEPAHIASVELHAGDRSLLLSGTRLNEIDKLTLGDLVFTPEPSGDSEADSTSLRLSLPASPATPAIHIDDRLTAKIALHDGRVLTLPITVSAPRPVITLLGKSQDPAPGNDKMCIRDRLPCCRSFSSIALESGFTGANGRSRTHTCSTLLPQR